MGATVARPPPFGVGGSIRQQWRHTKARCAAMTQRYVDDDGYYPTSGRRTMKSVETNNFFRQAPYAPEIEAGLNVIRTRRRHALIGMAGGFPAIVFLGLLARLIDPSLILTSVVCGLIVLTAMTLLVRSLICKCTRCGHRFASAWYYSNVFT